MSQTSCIYKHTCTISGKHYIGQTVTSMERRWKSHQYLAKNNINPSNHFQNAIRKHGVDSFTSELLEENIPENVVNEKEKYYIQLYNSYTQGYNSSPGNYETGGIQHSQMSKDKMSTIYYEKSNEAIKAINRKIGLANRGSNNSRFKPWWYQINGQPIVEMREKSIREYALEVNVAPGTILFRLNTKNIGKVATRGKFKTTKFGYLTGI